MASHYDQRTAQIAAELGRLSGFLRDREVAYYHEPLPGSPAHLARDGSNWSKATFADVQLLTTSRLFAAQDHLVALSTLVSPSGNPGTQEISILGYEVATRSVLEASARAWWLLDPLLSLREQLARGLADWYQTELDRDRTMKDLGAKEDHGARVEEILKVARDHGLSTVKSQKRWLFDGQRALSNTRLVGEFLAGVGYPWGAGIYGVFAGTSHATPSAVIRRLNATEDPTGTHELLGTPGLDLDDVEVTTALAVVAIGAAERRRWHHYGWNIEDLDRVLEHVRHVCRP